MSIRLVAKKTWPILGIFALIGIGLAIGLTVTGIFIPFGVTLAGLIGAAVLLFLASVGVATLLIIAIDAINSFAPVPTSKTTVVSDYVKEAEATKAPKSTLTENLSAAKTVTTTSLPTSALNLSATTVHPPLLQTAPPSQLLPSGEQSRKDAEEVKNYIANLFQKDGELYKGWISLGGRACDRILEKVLKQDDYFYVESVTSDDQHRRYKIVFSHRLNEDFKVEGVDNEVNDKVGLGYFKKEVDKKCKKDIVKISTRDHDNKSFYKAEISPEDIQEILREIRSHQPASKKSQSL